MKKLFTLVLLAFHFSSQAQNPLFIPDTLSGPNYSLTMHQDSVQFFPGKISKTYAFNANHYLGPTLIFNKGTSVSILVTNQVGDTTTVHWHGMHVPPAWDGGPYSTILPGTSWNPQITIMDQAATYWYHPHLHMKTALQAIKGAAGLIIVRDSIESALMLPRKYGVDDFPIIVQSQQYDSLNQAMSLGMQDSTLLVNGTLNPYLNVPAQIVRMRLLNASGERTFNFGFSSNKQFHVIASDGGLLDSPYLTTRIRLSPGERAEILLDLNGMNSQFLFLMCYGTELTMGIQGGPTMPMPVGSPPMNSPLNGIDYTILKINVGSQTANPVVTIPSTLTTNIPLLESQATTTRTIRFTADSLMVMDGPFYFNDSSFNMMRIDYTIPLNSVEIWKLVNETMVAHPFHLHDVQFYILDRNGIAPSLEEQGRKDVVLVPPGDSIRFITKFTDFTDSVIPYMFHCHILMHEDDGMMGSFKVVDTTSTTAISELKNITYEVLPNPVSQILLINFKNEIHSAQLKVISPLGETILMQEIKERKSMLFNMSNVKNGIYFLQINSGNSILTTKIIKQ